MDTTFKPGLLTVSGEVLQLALEVPHLLSTALEHRVEQSFRTTCAIVVVVLNDVRMTLHPNAMLRRW